MERRGTRVYLLRGSGWLAAALAACLASAWGQNGPHLGYAYPAGGKQGTVVHVTVGGQFLRDPEEVYVSGTGVSAEVEQYLRPLNNQELGETAWFMRGHGEAALERPGHGSGPRAGGGEAAGARPSPPAGPG